MKNLKLLIWLIIISIFANINLTAVEKDDKWDNDREEIQDDDMEGIADIDEDIDEEEDDWTAPQTVSEMWEVIFEKLDDLNKKETLEFYKKNICKTLEEEAAKLLKKDPEWAVDFFMESFEKYAEMKEEEKENPEAFRLWVNMTKQEAVVYKLVDKITQLKDKKTKTDNDGTTIAADTAKLKEALGLLFEFRIKSEKIELKELEEEVKEFESYIKKRQANKDKIVEKRLSKLLGDEDDLAW